MAWKSDMSPDQELHNEANDPAGREGSTEPGDIARAGVAKIRWIQRVVSPWTRRWLQREAAPAPGEERQAPAHSQMALTTMGTDAMVNHVQRTVSRSTVWRPDVGALQPAMVDRFTGAIVQRFPEVGSKYELHPLETRVSGPSDLILAGAPGQPDLEEPTAPEYEAEAEEPESVEPPPLITMKQLREILADRTARPSQPTPAPGPTSLPGVRRVAAGPSEGRPPSRTLPPGTRRFSWIEEVAASPEASEAPPVQRRPVEETPAPAPAVAAEGAAPPVQRQIAPTEGGAGLEDRVLARAASRAHLPINEPLRPAVSLEPEPGRLQTAEGAGRTPEPTPSQATRTRLPAQMTTLRMPQAQVQRHLEEERAGAPPAPPVQAAPVRPQAAGSELPLPPVSRALPTGLIQRQPARVSTGLTSAPQGVGMVQRAATSQAESASQAAETGPVEAEAPEPDLNSLARQIYPLIKRMLTVERERRS